MTNLIATFRAAVAKRRAYRRALNEIFQLNERELNDMNVDRETLIAGIHREVYGAAR